MHLLLLLFVVLTWTPLSGLSQTTLGAAPLAGPSPIRTDLVPYDLQVYPVPTRSTLHVEFQAPEAGQLNVSCVDLLGRSLLSDALLEATSAGRLVHDLQLESLEAGTYVLRLIYQPLATGRPLVLYRRFVVE